MHYHTVGVESAPGRDPDYGRSRDSRLTDPARNKQQETSWDIITSSEGMRWKICIFGRVLPYFDTHGWSMVPFGPPLVRTFPSIRSRIETFRSERFGPNLEKVWRKYMNRRPFPSAEARGFFFLPPCRFVGRKDAHHK